MKTEAPAAVKSGKPETSLKKIEKKPVANAAEKARKSERAALKKENKDMAAKAAPAPSRPIFGGLFGGKTEPVKSADSKSSKPGAEKVAGDKTKVNQEKTGLEK